MKVLCKTIGSVSNAHTNDAANGGAASLSLAPQAPLLAEQLALQPERLTFVDETVLLR